MSATVTVYTSPACPACTATKRHLNRRSIPFIEVPINGDDAVVAAIAGFRTAPVVRGVTAAGEKFSFDGFRPDRLNALAG